jgi:hypothetical protein
MQTHDSRLYRLEELNMHALRRIKYSNSEMGGTNNYRLLELVLGIMPACPYIYGYN